MGLAFSGAAIAGALEQTVTEVDAQCEPLAAQGQFIEAIGLDEWPDGTISGRYRFQHPLYNDVLYEQIGEARRVRLHRRIGAGLEAGYGEQTNKVVTTLAMHFDRGRDTERAINYCKLAAEQALSRYAYPEALDHFTRVIETLKQQPESEERDLRELEILILLAPLMCVTHGLAAPEVEQTFHRAQTICNQLGDTTRLFVLSWNLWKIHLVRAEVSDSRDQAEQLLELTKKTQNADMELMAHLALAAAGLFRGEIMPAHVQAETVISRYDRERHSGLAAIFSQEDPGVSADNVDTWILWLSGFPDQSATRMQETLALARALGNPHSMGQAMVFGTIAFQLRREPQATRTQAVALKKLSAGHNMRWIGIGKVLNGWALAQLGEGDDNLAEIKRSLELWRATGAGLAPRIFLDC